MDFINDFDLSLYIVLFTCYLVMISDNEDKVQDSK